MTLSGYAALGYQVVWTRQFGVWLGHEMVAVLAVVTAFFGGLAAGAWLLSRFIERSAFPGRWYVILELIISIWALMLTLLLPEAGARLVALVGETPSVLRHWSIGFIGTFLLMLPATLAMGATLPAIEKVFGRAREEGYAIGGLYGANTFGAVGGVIITAFFLAPRIGYSATAYVCVAVNLLCAVIAFRAFGASSTPFVQASGGNVITRNVTIRKGAILWILALTGFLGIGYEVAVVRVLSQITDNTVYTFASLLAVYLAGTAMGGVCYQRWLSSYRDSRRLAFWLLVAVATACLTGFSLLWIAEPLRVSILHALGIGTGAALAAEAMVAMTVFVLPTLAMGALFSHLSVTAKELGWSFGSALAANTLGATLAAPVVGVLLIPELGPRTTLTALCLGYLLVVPRASWQLKKIVGWAAVPAVFASGLMIFAPPLAFITVPEGGRVLSHQDGVMASVSVLEDAQGVRTLHINNREQEGSNFTWYSDGRQGWLPLLIHPKPERALFLGVGTGVTSLAASLYPGLSVDAVELLPEVTATSNYFSDNLPVNFDTDRRNVIVGDARRYVRASTNHYDVIVADLFHPARNGSGALYTVEHFAAIRERLSFGGLVCQWLPLHQMDIESLLSVVSAFRQVFPNAAAILATNSLDTPVIGLVAHRDGEVFALQAGADLSNPVIVEILATLQLDEELAVAGSFFADPSALRAFAAGVAPNTDDHPIVSHRAPTLLYNPQDTPRSRLTSLVQQWTVNPVAVLTNEDLAESAGYRARLGRYWQARNHYLLAGMAVRPSADLSSMLAQVEEPLLETLAISADFRPAYDPLLNMALAMVEVNPRHSVMLLQRLARIQPERHEAAQALRRIASLYPSLPIPSMTE